jgi:hypothetical protein
MAAPRQPLRVLILRDARDAKLLPYEEALTRAFQGGRDASGYLATGEDLGIQVQPFTSTPPEPAAQMLDAFCHTLVIVLVGSGLLEDKDPALLNWVEACWKHVAASDGRHGAIALPLNEELRDDFTAKRAGLSALQIRPAHEFGEAVIRPAMVALFALDRSRLLLARGLSADQRQAESAARLRLFISHAKLDGLPLAQALKHQIDSTRWLSRFYDADDIPAGSDWKRELDVGVGSSLIVILRSDVYDGRHWCQEEVLWSDEYATPAVLVDARTTLNFPAGILPFDRVPTVRIPDGNLMRVLFAAVREGVRFLLFKRRTEEMRACGELPQPIDLRVFCFTPSMAALLRACQSLASTRQQGVAQVILYPDPALRTGSYEAAQALVAAVAPGARLATPTTLAALGGGTP